jgi:hypothetical protein
MGASRQCLVAELLRVSDIRVTNDSMNSRLTALRTTNRALGQSVN